MLLVFYALTFSACSAKEYIAIPCSIETPKKLYDNKPCMQIDDFEFAKCIIITKEALVADYSNLLLAFNACK
jgi:hypothetical protein